MRSETTAKSLGFPPTDTRYYQGEYDLTRAGYDRREFVEFAQLFISDSETIFIPEDAATRPTTRGRWVQGWFMVTPKMVDRYRLALSEQEAEWYAREEKEYQDSLRGYTMQEAYDHENPTPLENPMDWEK